jgi:molybdopterin synthase catalytic subunit
MMANPIDPTLPEPPTPPVVIRTALGTEPLSVTEHEEAVAHSTAGAVVSFAGVVRDHDGGRGVARLS